MTTSCPTPDWQDIEKERRKTQCVHGLSRTGCPQCHIDESVGKVFDSTGYPLGLLKGSTCG